MMIDMYIVEAMMTSTISSHADYKIINSSSNPNNM